MPTLVQLVHGYPPRELAGTERYAQRLSAELAARGWTVHVIAATRAPGHGQGTVLREEMAHGEVIRVVNNLVWRPLAQREKDSLVEARVRQHLHRLAPDLVHVQHLIHLSAHLPMPCPAVGTLHDAWAWCPRGGTLLEQGDRVCEGPSAERCPPCVQQQQRGARMEHGLAAAAGLASRMVPPEHLHRAWRRLPEGVRALTRRGPAPPTASASDWRRRQEAVRRAWNRLDRRLAPSRFLADLAQTQGLDAVSTLPHGVAPGPPRAGGGPLAFVGSLTPHKGAHLAAAVGAELWGPATDPDYVRGLPPALLRGICHEVPALLARAEALVMGSVWPENAPLVALEARASGCPVIAPRIGGLPELVEDGVDGLLYEPGDVDDLRAKVARLRSAPPLRPRSPLTFEAHTDRLLEIYGAVL